VIFGFLLGMKRLRCPWWWSKKSTLFFRHYPLN